MGIGNSTAAAALCCALAGATPEQACGRGTGLDDEGLARKRDVVTRALTLNSPAASDPVGALAAVGGFELGVLAGLALGAAGRGVPVLVDGYPASAAVLVAAALAPALPGSLIAAHRSSEPGTRSCSKLGLAPAARSRAAPGRGQRRRARAAAAGRRAGDPRRDGDVRIGGRRRQRPLMTAIRAELRALAAAVTLLTRLPVGSRIHIDGEDVARSLAWLPLVGVALGGAIALAARGLEGRLDDGPAAVLIVAAWALATGAIHLDGLADSADALGGGDRERRLAIMRDSQIGSFGALALVLVVVLKITLVAAVLARGHHLWLIAIPAVARAASSALSAALPYARDEGTGAALVSGGRRAERLAVAVATALVVALACARLRGLLAVVAVLLVAVVVGRLAQRRLGGVTGDVLGATIELAECAALVALLAGR